ncbi:MAG: aminotransferase class V-fold PLP-dependent enzyme [Bacteroidetes bacterium]|nr:aminotransferase class V-fold PLP-dependent enzyme [Bacteroidota bacterium]
MKDLFYLNPAITFLNFGSFGACPKPIFEDYQKWQLELEYEPVQFVAVNGLQYLKQSREALANYIHCDANDVVYTSNPSYAMSIVAKSFDLKRGDEILTNNLEYGAMDYSWNYYCEKASAVYKRQPITLPLTTKEKFIEEFFSGLTANTKAIFISQITSTTALIFPVKEICEIAKSKGLFTIVDGAHVPGHIDLNLQELKADVYTGACHKWMLTPKGCSFLYVKKEHQHLFDPLVISWGFKNPLPSESKFIDYHQMQGTRDFSAFLTVPKAIEFLNQHNWKEKSKACHELVIKNAQRFYDLLGSYALSPLTNEFVGQMLSIPIKTTEPMKLQRLLFEKYNVEIPVMPHADQVYLRYSINVFNTQHDLDVLYNAVEDILKTSDLIKR